MLYISSFPFSALCTHTEKRIPLVLEELAGQKIVECIMREVLRNLRQMSWNMQHSIFYFSQISYLSSSWNLWFKSFSRYFSKLKVILTSLHYGGNHHMTSKKELSSDCCCLMITYIFKLKNVWVSFYATFEYLDEHFLWAIKIWNFK